MTKLPIDFKKAKTAQKTVRAIAHPLRLEILSYIDQKKTTVVGHIYLDIKMDQSICSQHLKILRDADLVIVQRDGRNKMYSINYDKVSHINEIIQKL